MRKLCEAGSGQAGDRNIAKMCDFWTPIFFEEKTQRTKTYNEALLPGVKRHSPGQSPNLRCKASLSMSMRNPRSGNDSADNINPGI